MGTVKNPTNKTKPAAIVFITAGHKKSNRDWRFIVLKTSQIVTDNCCFKRIKHSRQKKCHFLQVAHLRLVGGWGVAMKSPGYQLSSQYSVNNSQHWIDFLLGKKTNKQTTMWFNILILAPCFLFSAFVMARGSRLMTVALIKLNYHRMLSGILSRNSIRPPWSGRCVLIWMNFLGVGFGRKC